MSHPGSAGTIFALFLLTGCAGPRAPTPQGGFRDAAAETGLDFRHTTGGTGQFYLPEIMGSGVALLDFDGDGDLDVFLVQGASGGGEKASNRLYRNMLKETGQLKFTDVTERAGLNSAPVPGNFGMGVAVGDYNNDGYPDLYVTGFGSNLLYRNNGDGTFTDVTKESGLGDGGWSTSASFVDYDKDGLLDLYVVHYLDFTVKGNKNCSDAAGGRDYCAPSAYKPLADRLYRNMGNDRFEDVTQAAGIGSAIGAGMGVAAGDFNGDGWPDVYVTNDGSANFLWLNNGNGTFREASLLSGAAYSGDGVARAGMGIAAGDFDGSGRESLLVTNLTREGATLYQNTGNGQFADATPQFGLYQPTIPFTGFGVGWFDYDNDSRPDLFMANGAVTMMESLRGEPYPYHQRNLLLHNEGARFRDVSQSSGAPFGLSEVGRGAAFGDIDNNGTVDIVVANNMGPVRLLLNNTVPHGHWLELKLRGQKSNRDGAGARVTVLRPGKAALMKRVHTDGSYLSASDIRVHFGLAESTQADVVVEWPSGLREKWQQVRADSDVALREGGGIRPNQNGQGIP